MWKQKNQFRLLPKISQRWFPDWGSVGCGLLAFSIMGCSHNQMPASLNSFAPSQGISGQWEPEVDYEAEAAKAEAKSE